MSELTTGLIVTAVAVPIVAGVGLFYAGKYCYKQYRNMVAEIEATNERLKMIETNPSPLKMAAKACVLHEQIRSHPIFKAQTLDLPVCEKEILASAIAVEKTPLKAYLPAYVTDLEKGKIDYREVIKKSSMDYAEANFKHVASVVMNAAKATGFNAKERVIQNTKDIKDIIFTDDQGRNLSAYIKLNKELNPTLALDLEGFGKNDPCSEKMDEIVKYLTEHGVSFSFKKLKHNNPTGVLRKSLHKAKERVKAETSKPANEHNIQDYLTSGGNTGFQNTINI